jgi:dTDP-4-amino-4,6-dideoxygalactose transaminase
MPTAVAPTWVRGISGSTRHWPAGAGGDFGLLRYIPSRQGGFGVAVSKPSVCFQWPGRLTTSAAARTPTTNTSIIAATSAARTFDPRPLTGGSMAKGTAYRAREGSAASWLNLSATMSPAQATEKIPVFDVQLNETHVEAVAEALRSGWLTMGPRIKEFEAEFAEHIGAKHAIAVNSCTAALHLAYLAAGIGPGDEVIVPGITFVASAAAVRYCGGTPVLAEVIGQEDLGLDPADVERRITPRTKAVCAVHYGGYAAPLAALVEICERHGLALIEDAAHSPEATLPGESRKLGTYGLAGTFSFFSNKILSCGEGGLLATDDDGVAELARSRRSHAMTSGTWDRHRGHAMGYDVVEVGYNYRLDEPRAALLSARLPDLAADIQARRELTGLYRELLADLDGVTLPYGDEQVAASSCYVMPAMVEAGAERRDAVRTLLSERHGVQTSVLYPSINEFTAYGAGAEGLPRCERVARTQLTLPLYPHLGEQRLRRVATALRESLAEAAA